MDRNREQQIQNFLGMAQRARCIVSGGFAVEQSVKARTAAIVLLAEDAEKNSKEKYAELADKYRIPWRTILTRESMGACMGKEYRAVAALLDEGFRKKLLRLLED